VDAFEFCSESAVLALRTTLSSLGSSKPCNRLRIRLIQFFACIIMMYKKAKFISLSGSDRRPWWCFSSYVNCSSVSLGFSDSEFIQKGNSF
jgi:hypothetical protein